MKQSLLMMHPPTNLKWKVRSFLELIITSRVRHLVRWCCIIYQRQYIFDEKCELIPDGLEGICGYVTFPNKSKPLVSNIYRPPNSPISWLDKMNVLLENVGATKLEFVNTGDLNCELLKQSLENHTKHFVYKCEIHQLSQHIKKPTRIIPYSRTLFDMILTSNPNKIVEHNVKAVGIADHCLVYCVTSFKSHVPTERDMTIEIRYFKQFHIDDFILDLEHCS